MPRSRMIKPEFWDDEKLATISRDSRLTFIGLWNYADDYGVVRGHATWLKNKIYPYDDIKIETFQKWLKELEVLKCIIPFQTDNEKFYYIRAFTTHQTINRPSLQRNPEPPCNILDDSLSAQGVLIDETEVKYKQKLKRSNECESTFESFWNIYPKKKAKQDALKVWIRISPENGLVEQIISALNIQRKTDDWIKEDGKFVPLATTWLNGRRWEDEVQTIMASNPIEALKRRMNVDNAANIE